jgi:hypothetical protein
MLKVAMIATVVLAAVSTAALERVASTPAATPTSDLPCQAGQPLDLVCDMRAIDTDSNGTISAAELANFALPAALARPLQATPDTGLAFQDAAIEPGSVLPASLDREHSPQQLIPALFALGALVVLLRKRPT